MTRFCPKHPAQKMVLLLTSWACDLCDGTQTAPEVAKAPDKSPQKLAKPTMQVYFDTSLGNQLKAATLTLNNGQSFTVDWAWNDQHKHYANAKKIEIPVSNKDYTPIHTIRLDAPAFQTTIPLRYVCRVKAGDILNFAPGALTVAI